MEVNELEWKPPLSSHGWEGIKVCQMAVVQLGKHGNKGKGKAWRGIV
jgi:hypothetical protein